MEVGKVFRDIGLAGVALLLFCNGGDGQAAQIANHADCTAVPLQPGEMALFRDIAGGEYALFSAKHGDQAFTILSDFAANWRGHLSVGADGRARLGPASAPSITLLCEDSSPAQMTVFRGSDAPIVAQRVPLSIRKVSFSNGGVRLSGTIFAPQGQEMLPGVVFVHGSGPSQRMDFAEFGLRAAGNGIVALAYDKRGTGSSTGDWETASFSDLAGDATAALGLLKAQSEVDPACAGLFGASQGAWVGAIAAANAETAFFIASGGGPITPAAQESYRRLLLASKLGLDEAEMEIARSTLTAWFEYLREPEEHASRVSALWRDVDVANSPWRRALGLPSRDPTEGEWPLVRQRFARELHFKPLSYYAEIDAPILGILGLEDEAVPVAETILAFNALPPEKYVTVVGIPGADHGWFVETPEGRRYQAPEAYHVMMNWIRSATRRMQLPD